MSQDNVSTKNDKAHLFHWLQAELGKLISSTPPGERLLAEPELAKTLGVSRATLREAMRTFESQGLIRRRQGVGTFVVNNPLVINTGLEVLESIEKLAKKIDLKVSMGDLQINHINADAEQAKALDLEIGTPLVEVSRVIYAGGRPIAYLIDILPNDILSSHDLEKGFTGSVLDLLLERGPQPLDHSQTEVRVSLASSKIAKDLEIQRGHGLLMFVACLYTKDGRIIDYSKSYFLPGYFQFNIVRRVGNLLT